MITNLREAKSSLSQLVRRAEDGEEILITVRGKPKARLVGIAPDAEEISRAEWAEELTAGAEAAKNGDLAETSQEYWDDAREDRF